MARTLAQWLDWQSGIHPKTIELGLSRMHAMLGRLAPQRPSGPVITVAGTNGKGSVCAYLEAVQAADGLKVGTYTSPHLVHYNERIRIGGEPIGDAALVEAFEAVEAVRGDLALTFFEYGTLAAFVAFARAGVDAWVLEVGLGGRLDAVNAIDADAGVVVSIGLDHTDWLGPDVESIGREKAGIFRAGRPAVLGSRTMPASVAATAQSAGARLVRPGIEYDLLPGSSAGTWTFRGSGSELADLPAPALPGPIQRENAATALAALDALGRLPPRAIVARALGSVQLAARFQRFVDARGVEWVVDVAHNPPAAEVLAQNLKASRAGRTLAVIGILADKDAAGIGAALAGVVDDWIAIDLAGERTRAEGALAGALAPSLGAPLTTAPGVEAALERARGLSHPGERVIVMGSFHVAGPALEWLRLYLQRLS